MTATTVELPDTLHAQVQELARATNRPVTEVLTDAVAHYIAWDHWYRATVEEGHRSAEQGPLVPAEEVWANFLRRGLLTDAAIAAVDAESTGDELPTP